MREIKFKFYCDESCTMSRIFTLEELVNGRYDFHCDINKAIKLQYTGLKDKNEVEIYEYMEIDDNFEVSFKDGCYVLTNISNGDIILLYNYLRHKNGQVAVTKEYTKI